MIWRREFLDRVYGVVFCLAVGSREDMERYWFKRYRADFAVSEQYGRDQAARQLAMDGANGAHIIHTDLKDAARVDRWIYLQSYNPDSINSVTTLSHECLHGALHVLRQRGVRKFRIGHAEEALTYYHEWLFATCLRQLARRQTQIRKGKRCRS